MEVTGCAVGIDIGTTSVKCCILDSSGQVLEEKSAVHEAWIKHESHLYHEQDATQIINVVHSILNSTRTTVSSNAVISVTGQMHGIIFWNGRDLVKGTFTCSPLITWMDERIPKSFVDQLPRWDCGELHVGFGLVTLAWFHTSGTINEAWTCCGTIMDMLIAYLSQSAFSVIGIQNAYSWGYCSYEGHWTAPDDYIPPYLLPKICSSEEIVGMVQRPNFGLPFGAKLLASCGDLQSTVYPLLAPETAVLNLGTSAQLCFTSCADYVAPVPLLTEPFFGALDKEKIIVAASMNGGNAIDLIAEKIVEWAAELSDARSLRVNYAKLESILNKEKGFLSSTVEVKPTFMSERGVQQAVSSISGISTSTSIEEVLHATARGVVSGLFRLLSPQQLQRYGIKHIKLAGNAAKTYFMNEILRQCEGQLDVTVPDASHEKCSAAYGAALHALRISQAM